MARLSMNSAAEKSWILRLHYVPAALKISRSPFDRLRRKGIPTLRGDERYAITPLRFTLEVELERK